MANSANSLHCEIVIECVGVAMYGMLSVCVCVTVLRFGNFVFYFSFECHSICARNEMEFVFHQILTSKWSGVAVVA